MNILYVILGIFSFLMVNLSAQDYQLAEPILEFTEVLFHDEVKVNAKLDLEGTVIRYTLDESEVDESSKKFTKSIMITEDCTLNIKAFHADFITSNTVSQGFKKVGSNNNIRSINLLSEAHESYRGNGKHALSDLKKGSMNFQDGRWLGFQGRDVNIELVLNSKRRKVELLIGYLVDKDAWIFGPGQITIYGLKNDRYEEIVNVKLDEVVQNQAPLNDFFVIKNELNFSTDKLKIEIERFREIPEWHPATVDDTWIFLDEILVR